MPHLPCEVWTLPIATLIVRAARDESVIVTKQRRNFFIDRIAENPAELPKPQPHDELIYRYCQLGHRTWAVAVRTVMGKTALEE